MLDVLHHHYMEGRVWRLTWFLCSLEEFCKGPMGWEMSHSAIILSTASALHKQSFVCTCGDGQCGGPCQQNCFRDGIFFDPWQKEVILEFLRGRDIFVSFPVESGKVGATPFRLKYSIVWKECPRVLSSLQSPIVSLMKDKVHSQETKGINSVLWQRNQIALTLSRLFPDRIFSPEAPLCGDVWRELLISVYKKHVVASFVINEAHLIKQWWIASHI